MQCSQRGLAPAWLTFIDRLKWMRAIFHVKNAIADVTDFEFNMLAYYVSGTFEPGMEIRFRPESRLVRTYVLHSVWYNGAFSDLMHRPCYDLKIDCGSLESVEFLHGLHIDDEDVELVSMPES